MFSFSKKIQLTRAQQAEEARLHLQTLSPLVETLYHSRAVIYLNRASTLFFSFLLYVAGILMMVFAMIMNRVFPFHVLNDFLTKKDYVDALTPLRDIQAFDTGVRLLAVLCGIVLIGMGWLLQRSSRKSLLLHKASVALKELETYFREIAEAEPATAIEPADHEK